MTRQADIEECAAFWLIEQEDPHFSAERRTAFESWLTEDSRHRETYAAVERAWHRTLILRRRPTNPARLRKDFADRLMRTRDLQVHDAERLTRDAFALLRAPHYAPNFESDPWFSLEPVIARIITQDWLCFTLSSNDTVTPGGPSEISRPLQIGLVDQLIKLLAKAVENLSNPTKQVYTLRKVCGLSEDEIAGELDLTPDSVSAHLDQAAYSCATEVINGLPPDRQGALFESLDACQRIRSDSI